MNMKLQGMRIVNRGATAEYASAITTIFISDSLAHVSAFSIHVGVKLAEPPELTLNSP
jgi:hypothetical protein